MIARCHRVGAAQLWAFGALFVFATGIAADAALLGTHASQAFSHVCFVLSIGCLFSGFAGTYAWLGRRLRRRLPERWGIAHFITAFVGLNLALLPAHVLPLVPRLAGIIDADTGAILIAVGTLLFFLSLGLFAVVLVRSAAASDWSAADAWAPWIPPRAKTP
jgi:heme/copper-type cytochrome/quinol oxidase subunit 1